MQKEAADQSTNRSRTDAAHVVESRQKEDLLDGEEDPGK